MNAAFLNIITEWLSDVKLGCETAFYLNESFCCWGEDNGRMDFSTFMIRADSTGCADWHRWSSLTPINYVLYITFAVRLNS